MGGIEAEKQGRRDITKVRGIETRLEGEGMLTGPDKFTFTPRTMRRQLKGF